MSQTVAIKLELDAGQSVQEVQSLEDAIKDVNKSTNALNAGEQFEKLNTSIKQNGGSVEALTKAIKSYQTIALSAGRESAVGKQAIQKAALLKDELVDLNNEINRVSNDGADMQAALQMGSTVTAGYQAFAGVTALVGVENEELMKTMVKLQAAQSTLQGIEQVRLSLEKESYLMIKAKAIQTKVLTGLTWAYNLAIGGGTKAMKLFRLALISTGLGAIVVLIGTLIAKWDDWKDSIMAIIEFAFAPFIKVLQWLGVIESDLEKQRREAAEAYLDSLKEQQAEMEEMGKAVNDRYDHEIAMAKAVGKETHELERQKLKDVQNRVEQELLLIAQIVAAEMKAGSEITEEKKEEYRERIKALEDLALKTRRQEELLEANHNESLRKEREKEAKAKSDNAKKWAEKRKAQREKEVAEELKEIEEAAKLKEALRKQIEDFAVLNIQDETQRKLAELALSQERERQQLIEKYGKDTELMKELETKQKGELDALMDSFALADKEKQDSKDLAETERLAALAETRKAIDDKAAEDKITTEQALFDAQTSIARASSNVIGQMAALANKESKAGKALALTQIAIDTALGFANGLRIAQQGAAATGPAAPFAFPIFYATQIGAVMSAVGKAKSILKAGSSVTPPSVGSSGSIGSGSSSSTGTQNTGSTDFKTQKVVVLDSDLKAVRERRESVEEVSVVG